MIPHLPQELLEKNLITEEQYNKIEPITTGKIRSVFYELRTMLYLGVMLLASGLGILIYENIGDMGHLLSIIGLCAIMIVCFWYVIKQRIPYSNEKVKPPTPYYDYVLLLGCLLVVAIQGYLQFQYNVFDNGLGLSTLLSAAFFFAMSYRYDHVGILSMGIAALASFWSISVSPQKWYSSEFFSQSSNLHVTAIIFSTVLAAAAMALELKSIKKHFTFTYINFCCFIFFTGATAGLFMDDGWNALYVLLIYAGCLGTFYFARYSRSFLFLLYMFVFGYIATTYVLAISVLSEVPELWFFYSMGSCAAFIIFIVRYKNYFTRNA
jgi:hypothetical protein